MTRIEVRKTYKFYIGGAFPRSESGRSYQPGGAPSTNVARGSRKDLRDAVGAARKALAGWQGKTAYTASKAALGAFTSALAEEVGGEGILVNAVAPFTMDTAANRKAMPQADFGRWAKTADVAAVIAFLASPANRVVRGALVPVPGGGRGL